MSVISSEVGGAGGIIGVELQRSAPQSQKPIVPCMRPAARSSLGDHKRWQFNPSKLGAAFLSAVNSGRLAATGVLKITAGSVLDVTGVGALPGTGIIMWGTWNIHAAGVALDKASLLAGEAVNENFSDASMRNFQSLLPMGQHFDDPGEPRALEFYSEHAHHLVCMMSEIGTISP